SLPGSRENGGEPCRLSAVDVLGRGFVIVTTRRVCAIDTRTPFNDIEVELKDPLLAEDEFGHRYQGGLRTLAEEGAACSEEQVFDQLLRDRGTSARATAFHVFRGSESNLVPIKSMMLVETRVLRSDDSVLQIGRDLAERNESVPLVIGRAVNPGLHAALHMDCRCGRVDPPHGNKKQHGKRPEKQY